MVSECPNYTDICSLWSSMNSIHFWIMFGVFIYSVYSLGFDTRLDAIQG